MTEVLSPARRLLAASFVSQAGNWLTFTGLAQLIFFALSALLRGIANPLYMALVGQR